MSPMSSMWSMRSWLAISAALVLGCETRSQTDPEVERATAALIASRDPAAAAPIVTALAQRGCPGLRRALAALAGSRISGRPLSGLVDDAVAAADESGCANTAAAATLAGERPAPFQLARARLKSETPREALAELEASSTEPAIRLRRAEIHAALDQPREALAELEQFLARVPDDARARAARVEGLLALGDPDRAAAAATGDDDDMREARVAALAAAGRLDEAARLVAASPPPDRPRLARRVAALAPARDLDRIDATFDLELVAAFADRIAAERGEGAALPLRQRAADAAPARAELADSLAHSLLALGRVDEALAAWDRAAAAAPAAAIYRLAPIRALAAAKLDRRARHRAAAEATRARRSGAAEDLVTASAAAAAAGDRALALRLAGEARAASPRDGRMAMLVGERREEAGDAAGAASAWTELLICGAHGRPWHRHEVAGRLVRLARAGHAADVARALARTPSCRAVDPDGLASYLDQARRAAQGTQ